jgi:hypothetical protein
MSFPQTHHFQSTHFPDIYKPSPDNLVDTNAPPFAPNSQHKSYVLDTSSVWPLSTLIVSYLIFLVERP